MSGSFVSKTPNWKTLGNVTPCSFLSSVCSLLSSAGHSHQSCSASVSAFSLSATSFNFSLNPFLPFCFPFSLPFPAFPACVDTPLFLQLADIWPFCPHLKQESLAISVSQSSDLCFLLPHVLHLLVLWLLPPLPPIALTPTSQSWSPSAYHVIHVRTTVTTTKDFMNMFLPKIRKQPPLSLISDCWVPGILVAIRGRV